MTAEHVNQCSLADKSCKPCKGDVPPLKGQELQEYFEKLAGWELVEDERLRKKWKFKNFKQAWRFVDRISELAEQENHHPKISFTWGRVEVELITHKISGLSEADFVMAAKIDQIDVPGEKNE